MQIQEVIKTINQMQADGVIQRYAVGGAVGATFYLELWPRWMWTSL